MNQIFIIGEYKDSKFKIFDESGKRFCKIDWDETIHDHFRYEDEDHLMKIIIYNVGDRFLDGDEEECFSLECLKTSAENGDAISKFMLDHRYEGTFDEAVKHFTETYKYGSIYLVDGKGWHEFEYKTPNERSKDENFERNKSLLKYVDLWYDPENQEWMSSSDLFNMFKDCINN